MKRLALTLACAAVLSIAARADLKVCATCAADLTHANVPAIAADLTHAAGSVNAMNLTHAAGSVNAMNLTHAAGSVNAMDVTHVGVSGHVAQAFRPANIAQATSPANATLTAVPGVKVGHFTLTERPTGCTVVLVEQGAAAGVDVRGAAPATRDTDLLNPTKMVQQIFGISLSGGSLYGLSTVDGVLRFLEDKNIGIVYGNRHIPIVPGASIFDLGVGDARIRPTADCGYRAAQAASSAPVVEGSVGAGAGATLGKITGMEHAMRSGVGSAAITMPDGLIIAALVVVNPVGDVIDPATGKVVAGARTADGNGFADARAILRSGARRTPRGDNSTIGVVATNATLTKTQASYLAQMTDDGYARSIYPIHTMGDGDTIFAIATGSKAGAPDMTTIGALGAEVMAAAVIRAATQATSLPNLPAVRDLKK